MPLLTSSQLEITQLRYGPLGFLSRALTLDPFTLGWQDTPGTFRRSLGLASLAPERLRLFMP